MTGQLAQIARHPIKSHGRESLASVRLTAGEGVPFDRHWAVAHDGAKLVPGWNPCVNFARGAKAPQLMAISARLDDATGTIVLTYPKKPDLTFRPDDADDLARFLDWVGPLNPPDRAQPAQIVTAGRAMTDTEYSSISLINLASNTALSGVMGKDLSPLRWRGNLMIDGLDPWAEFDWVGKTLQIGAAVFEVVERITRCRATMANPQTGLTDADTLGVLNTTYGHQDFGVYARVTKGGKICVGDAVRLI